MKHLYSNGTDTYVAESLKQAQKLYLDDTGDPEDCANDPLKRISDDKLITIIFVDEENREERKRACQWADDNDTGLLCSTEY